MIIEINEEEKKDIKKALLLLKHKEEYSLKENKITSYHRIIVRKDIERIKNLLKIFE